MSTNQKLKIEAIYPLTVMQESLLFHHLSEGEDQGFLQVECLISGKIDLASFKESWKQVTLRHEVMRTSVHWKKIEKPILVVRPEKEIDWTILDWSKKSDVEQTADLNKFKEIRKKEGSNFEKNPLSVITLIQKSRDSYIFLWDCHHLLLDGWSSTIILKDVFRYYQSLTSDTKIELETLPSYKTFSNWKKKLPVEPAKVFWQKTFEGFQKAPLFEGYQSQESLTELKTYIKVFTPEVTNEIKKLAKSYRVTLNSLFQGIWSLLLHHYFKSPDITFGNTVSGRSISFPNIELMAGMFANVLPVRATLNKDNTFKNLLDLLQSQQQNALNYEYCSNEQIVSWTNQDEGSLLYNNLFVFENFPWETIRTENLTVTNFKSGITTSYPITAIFKIEDTLVYNLLVNTTIISPTVSDWFFDMLPKILEQLLSKEKTTIGEILDVIPSISTTVDTSKNNIAKFKQELNYVPPKNKLELTLVEIWENLFNTNPIGITDNFFHLGGKSFLSIRMFALIEKELKIKLPPTTLLEHPTIESLATVVNHKEANPDNDWRFLIPLKAKGNKAPLFCIHAGGGHVFFYKPLADAIDPKRPVFALQPMGIYGEDKMHFNIEQMAIDYANEIHKAQPQGTLNILVYCFSTAVGLEMAVYLKSIGRKTNLIVADTMAEHRLFLNKDRLNIRLSAFFKRIAKNPFNALKTMIGYRILFYLKPIKISLLGSTSEKNTERLRKHLVTLFNNYKWDQKIETVSLIVTEKIDDRFNNEIIGSWETLATQKIKIEKCSSRHATFFDYSDITISAKAIDNSVIEHNV